MRWKLFKHYAEHNLNSVLYKPQNQKECDETVKLILKHNQNMKITRWELSFGLYEGLLFGYRSYPDWDNNKIDHVFYLFIFDICLTLFYD